jgi:hypothetical protein
MMKTKVTIKKEITLTEQMIRELLGRPKATVTFYSAVNDYQEYGGGSPGYARVSWTEEEEELEVKK